MGDQVRVGVIGAAGYAGGEAVRLLSGHRRVCLAMATSESQQGRSIGDVFPNLAHLDLTLARFEVEAASRCDVVILAQEAGFAVKHAPELLESGVKVIDLSADYRLADAAAYPTWYGFEHSRPQLLEQAAYGLPERHRAAIRQAKLVANPGCYPTASILALAPLLGNGWIDPATIIIDAKSGVSGAGRSKLVASYLYSEVNDGLSAYGVAGKHRHTPEIEQELSRAAGATIHVTFTPHLVPMTRGILVTAYAHLARPATTQEIVERYREAYRGEPFVIVRDSPNLLSTKTALGSNRCLLSAAVDSRTSRVVVVAVIDNLVKGAAGQAVQNLNLMMGLDETEGLEGAGLWP